MQQHLSIFPDVAKDATLLSHGPYKFIRHPMYTSLLILTLAVIIENFSLLRVMLWFALLCDLLFKLHYEEQLLSEKFQKYSGYKMHSWKLIPFIF
mgnify:FL=1